MFEYIVGGSLLIISVILGGYSKYKEHNYQLIKDNEIESWIYQNKRKSIGKRASNLFRPSIFKSSKE